MALICSIVGTMRSARMSEASFEIFEDVSLNTDLDSALVLILAGLVGLAAGLAGLAAVLVGMAAVLAAAGLTAAPLPAVFFAAFGLAIAAGFGAVVVGALPGDLAIVLVLPRLEHRAEKWVPVFGK